MQWTEIVNNPTLQNLPFKIETNEWGQIVMTPAKARHGALQFRIASILYQLIKDGTVLTECAIRTTKGTKVADVSWASDARWAIIEDEFDVSVAPEICVEVLSPGNTNSELEDKRQLYFDAGAEEVWVSDGYGNMSFFNSTEKLPQSILVPTFPQQVKLR